MGSKMATQGAYTSPLRREPESIPGPLLTGFQVLASLSSSPDTSSISGQEGNQIRSCRPHPSEPKITNRNTSETAPSTNTLKAQIAANQSIFFRKLGVCDISDTPWFPPSRGKPNMPMRCKRG